MVAWLLSSPQKAHEISSKQTQCVSLLKNLKVKARPVSSTFLLNFSSVLLEKLQNHPLWLARMSILPKGHGISELCHWHHKQNT